MTKFFLDENFPKTAADWLRLGGHEAHDIRGTISEGCNDSDIFAMAQREAAVFLTTDRDFFHTVPHLWKSHHGVVVIALRQPDRKSILARLEWFLSHFGALELTNRVFELRDRTYVLIDSEIDAS